MKRIVRLTESDLHRIVRRVIREGYDTASTFKVGATTYTIEEIGTLNCKFNITISSGGKKMTFANMDEINKLTDANLKSTLIGISKQKLRDAGC